MRLLMIAPGFLPGMFSENLCNGKLVYALNEQGIEVDVISKIDDGNSYGNKWIAPWDKLQSQTHLINYPAGNSISRATDAVYSAFILGASVQSGVRWGRRAYELAVKLAKTHNYDAILSRSPGEIGHVIGAAVKRKTRLPWIANWNDPCAPIWPGIYRDDLTPNQEKKAHAKASNLLKAADVNTFPSESLLAHFKKQFPVLKDKQVAVIPHIGISDAVLPKSMTISSPYKELRILHSGNLSSGRNPEKLFAAMRILLDKGRKIRLDIQGVIGDFIKDLIGKYSLENEVHFLGSCPYNDSVAVMGTYDVLLLLEAELDEGIFFPSKFVDYAQSGRPILALSPVKGFVNDTISKYGGGLCVDNADTKAIVTALENLSIRKDNGTLDDLPSSGLMSLYEPSKIVAQYTNLIMSL